MTTTPAAYAQFGYTLAMTEQALTEVLTRHLAERDTETETWYALQVLSIRGPVLAREELSGQLERSRALNAELTQRLLERLEAEDLISGEDQVELTAQGRALHQSLRAYVDEARNALLSQFDLADVETTVRTMRAIGERAAEDTAAETR